MNTLAVLVFILALGSLDCIGIKPRVKEHCMKQEGVTEKDLEDITQMNVKCFHHCVFEKNGVIVNGAYVGNHIWCQNVQDANKCVLAEKVLTCSMLRRSG